MFCVKIVSKLGAMTVGLIWDTERDTFQIDIKVNFQARERGRDWALILTWTGSSSTRTCPT